MYRTHRDWANSVRKQMGLPELTDRHEQSKLSAENQMIARDLKSSKNDNDRLRKKIKYYEQQLRKKK